jgi:hypothetical protein
MKKIKNQTLNLFASYIDATYAYVGTFDEEIVYVSTIDNTNISRAYPEESMARDLAVVAAGTSDIRNWMGDSDRRHMPSTYDIKLDSAKFNNKANWVLIATSNADGVIAPIEGFDCPSQEYIVNKAKEILI